MALTATFVDGDTFTVVGDYTANFIVGRKVRAYCGVNGYRYGIVSAAAFAAGNTTVDLDQIVDLSGNDSTLTANLETVEWSVVGVAATGNQWVRNEIEVERYASFSEAIDNIGADDRVLSVSSTVGVAVNKTVPANVTLKRYQGGMLTIANGVTLTINGPSEIGLDQFFTLVGTGTVVFGQGVLREVRAEWWGLDAAAAAAVNAAAIDEALVVSANGGAPCVLPGGTYNINGVSLQMTAWLRGAGLGITFLSHNTAGYALDYPYNVAGEAMGIADLTVLCSASSTGAIRIGDTGAALGVDKKHHVRIENVKLDGPALGAGNPGTIGLNLCDIAQSTVRDVDVRDFEKGVLITASTENMLMRMRVWECVYCIHFGIAQTQGCGNDTMIQCVMGWGRMGADGWGLRNEGLSLRNFSPYYETSTQPATVNTPVWLTAGAMEYVEVAGRYDYTPGPVYTADLTIDAGANKCRFFGMHGSGGGGAPAAIGQPGVLHQGFHRHIFVGCDQQFMSNFAMQTEIEAGWVEVIGEDRYSGVGGANDVYPVRVGNHVLIGQSLYSIGQPPVAAARPAAGAGAPVPVVRAGSTDVQGRITWGTGAGPGAGGQVQVTFQHQRPNVNGSVVVTPINTGTEALGLFVSTVDANVFIVSTTGIPAGGQPNTTYGFYYIVIG